MQYIDQLQRSINISQVPKRIISLVPSLTEFLWYLELEKEVVGITKFCIKPADWYRNKKRIGGTKSVNIEEIRRIKPDLIIANKEENEALQIEELAKDFPVFITDIQDLNTCFEALNKLARILNKEESSIKLVKSIKLGMAQLSEEMSAFTCLYFIWQEPYMLAGENTFIQSILKHHGFSNLALNSKGRYPEFDWKNEKFKEPDFVFLSSEPFPFSEKHLEKFSKRFPNSKICLVDGEAYSWYGYRLQESISYFKSFYRSLTMTCQ